jgi:hypothetical protein
MAINRHEMGVLILIGAVAIILGYTAYLKVDVQDYPSAEVSFGGGMNMPVFTMTHGFVTGNENIEGVTNLPHRYPNVSGGNITALIHRGWSPMRKRAPHDSKWIECPPAEVMF